MFIRLGFSYLNGGYRCVVCGRIVYKYPICIECLNKYFSVNKELLANRCKKCGKELISTKNICSECKKNIILRNADRVIPLFSYRLWNKELLFLWKIKGNRNLSFLFSYMVNDVLKILNYKILVPVPPRKGKIESKGWDQIDELCSILYYKYGYTVLKLLKRVSTEEQKKLNKSKRLETIKSGYVPVDKKCLETELRKNNGNIPFEVCLIDDVCTTGATVECCCEILKKLGIAKVNVVTLFTVD